MTELLMPHFRMSLAAWLYLQHTPAAAIHSITQPSPAVYHQADSRQPIQAQQGVASQLKGIALLPMLHTLLSKVLGQGYKPCWVSLQG